MSAFVCAPSPSDGEITEILFTHTPLETADMADAEAFAARIDNTGVDTNAIIRLKVTGKLNAPEVSESELEGGVTVQSARKKFSIEADFYNDTDANYNAVRSFMHCGKLVLLYFVMGGKLYGGDSNAIDGISTIPNILPSSEGRDSYLKYTVRASWRATTMPARVAYPLA
jgi:hypothetical protein